MYTQYLLYYNIMAGNRFFFRCVRLFRFPVKSHFFCCFFTLQNSYFEGLLSLTVVNSNRPSFFQLVTMIDLHFDHRRTYTYTYFSSYSGKHFVDKTTERSKKNTRSQSVFRRITLFFFPVYSYCHSTTMICICRLPVRISFERKGKELLISLRHN